VYLPPLASSRYLRRLLLGYSCFLPKTLTHIRLRLCPERLSYAKPVAGSGLNLATVEIFIATFPRVMLGADAILLKNARASASRLTRIATRPTRIDVRLQFWSLGVMSRSRTMGGRPRATTEPNNRIERRVNDKLPSSSIGARGAHAER